MECFCDSVVIVSNMASILRKRLSFAWISFSKEPRKRRSSSFILSASAIISSDLIAIEEASRPGICNSSEIRSNLCDKRSKCCSCRLSSLTKFVLLLIYRWANRRLTIGADKIPRISGSTASHSAITTRIFCWCIPIVTRSATAKIKELTKIDAVLMSRILLHRLIDGISMFLHLLQICY